MVILYLESGFKCQDFWYTNKSNAKIYNIYIINLSVLASINDIEDFKQHNLKQKYFTFPAFVYLVIKALAIPKQQAITDMNIKY